MLANAVEKLWFEDVNLTYLSTAPLFRVLPLDSIMNASLLLEVVDVLANTLSATLTNREVLPAVTIAVGAVMLVTSLSGSVREEALNRLACVALALEVIVMLVEVFLRPTTKINGMTPACIATVVYGHLSTSLPTQHDCTSFWWSHLDSNQGPTAYETAALRN